MLKLCDSFSIPINVSSGMVTLNVVGSSNKALLGINDEAQNGVSAYQLQEGATYQYEFVSDNGHIYQFGNENEIIKFSTFRNHRNMGEINTGIYVGQLAMAVVDVDTNEEVGSVRLEVRSVKTDYESDYRTMLDDIASYYTDLVLLQDSPVTQQLEVDNEASSQTLYQKFSFVRSVVDSQQFQEAIHKIMANPVRKWTETIVQRNIVGVKHLSRRNIRQMATSNDRIKMPEAWRMGKPSCLGSVPRMLDVDYKRDTVDNQENQFVKFALRTFISFCVDLQGKKNATQRLRDEAENTISKIEGFLDSQFFRQVSSPSHLNMNSPVLQRKEGYREVLQAWLMFDLAAKLNWTGGNNIYEAGKKNVATLYEYWLFFKLQELISEFFDLDELDKKKLVKIDNDKIDLQLIQGRRLILRGKSKSVMRDLNVAFYYNRTFSKSNDEDNAIRLAGSWTMAMRPDYTLSLWPGNIGEAEAEEQDLITHIHFDAKYRLNRVILEDEKNISEELNEEKGEQELGIYKRADLLKMHAYKDAIRRTSGAYVLYPGTENRVIQGYHEIVPGLGAFSVRPGHWDEDYVPLRKFLAKVKAHMLDRASEREKMSYYQYDTYKEEKHGMVMDYLPEPIGDDRDFMPDATSVIVAYYKNREQLEWIEKNQMYNIRAGSLKGSLNLDSQLINARYILLHDDKNVLQLCRLIKGGPKIYTRAELVKMGYPKYRKKNSNEIDEDRESKSAKNIYLVFSLIQRNGMLWVEKEMRQYKWDVKGIILKNGTITRPYTTSLVSLLKRRMK
ncbi:DUF2357 domain-containing protein [uncultured Prevotella sp.]|uniref:DUF2357 domain-containing protein n=1 Tax=uncultured Prevotella sp. TaxID=159272 RepID=UPI0027E31BCB|nr:DUF2357 domain-containing protein [uncultured Prevotella sp.]